MEFYTSDKLNKFKLVDTVRKLLGYIDTSSDYYDVDYLKSIRSHIDPVRDFIEYYFDEIKVNVDSNAIDYIINRLYGVKGGPEVLEVMSSLLTVNQSSDSVNEFHVECEYEFPDITLLGFDTIRVTNINVFIDKLMNALYVLLFYRELNITIRHLIQVINGDLIEYTSTIVQPYVEIELTCDNSSSLPWKL